MACRDRIGAAPSSSHCISFSSRDLPLTSRESTLMYVLRAGDPSIHSSLSNVLLVKPRPVAMLCNNVNSLMPHQSLICLATLEKPG